MGFCAALSTTTSPLANRTTTTGLVAGNAQTNPIQPDVKDGDLVFLFFASTANPTTAWSTPTGYTLSFTQKNMTSSVGGRAALFHKVWRGGDSLSPSSSGPGGNVNAVSLIVRADTDGASLTIGNPPSSGITSILEQENTVAGTTFTAPKFNVDSTTKDYRILFVAHATGGIPTPPTVALSANNNAGVTFFDVIGNTLASNSVFVKVNLVSDAAGTESGTSTWTTSGSGKSYCLAVVVHDPNATTNGNANGYEIDPLTVAVPIYATGLEHLASVTVDTVAGSGGGGGISVF